MSTATATTLLTAEEFFVWANHPERGGTQYELEAGEIIEMPSPGEIHALVCWYVIELLSAYLRLRGEGAVLTNDGGQLLQRNPDTVRGPDIAVYPMDRSLEDAVPGPTERRPSLIVEVRSPSDRDGRILRRVRQYLDAGVLMVWVVDPEDRNVVVYEPDRFPDVRASSELLDGSRALPDFSCPVTDLFIMPKLRTSYRG